MARPLSPAAAPGVQTQNPIEALLPDSLDAWFSPRGASHADQAGADGGGKALRVAQPGGFPGAGVCEQGPWPNVRAPEWLPAPGAEAGGSAAAHPHHPPPGTGGLAQQHDQHRHQARSQQQQQQQQQAGRHVQQRGRGQHPSQPHQQSQHRLAQHSVQAAPPPQAQQGAGGVQDSGPMKQQQDNAARRQADLQAALSQARTGLSGLLGQRALLMRAARRWAGASSGAEQGGGGESAGAGDGGGGSGGAPAGAAQMEGEAAELRRLLAETAEHAGPSEGAAVEGQDSADTGRGGAASAEPVWLQALGDTASRHATEAQAEFQQLAQAYLILTQQLGIPPCAVPEAAWRAAAPGCPAPQAASAAPTPASMAIPSDLEQ
ncbi:MAG: hypothetical protein J3K34DRAFT_521776, partial [Monoraphidium minutum]